jgi:type IX secretion system PorP/SprF family membrane protein
MLNGFLINSAMAGYDGLTTFNLTSRQQWLGIENAPRTFSLTVQTRILKRNYIIKARPLRGNKFSAPRTGRVGMGISVFSDRNGYFLQTGVTLSYAYHISFPNAQLSFGVSGSMSQFKINTAGVQFRTDDPKTGTLAQALYYPDANIGVFFTNRGFYSGFSVAELLQSSVKFGNSSLTAFQLKRCYFFMSGYRFTEDTKFSYEPSFLVKTTEQLFPQLDASFKVYYRDDYWIGLSYRTGNAVITFIGLRKNKVYIGYAFDYNFSPFLRNTLGSHELNISLKFGDTAKRYKWLNRY